LQADNPEEFQMLPNFRVRIMPVVGTVPAVFGLVAATYVLNELSRKPLRPMLPAKASVKKMQKMLVLLYHAEERVYRAPRSQRLVSAADAQAAVMDGFNSRCAVSGAVDGLALRRFDRERPAAPGNLVLLAEALAKRHDAGEDVFGGDECRARVAVLVAMQQ
jgi:hypothetical protein